MFKRNQLEEAILRCETPPAALEPSQLRVRIKRLLDSDRKRPVKAVSLFNRNYAFYGAEAPGTGHEVWFTAYEVFALWVGLRLLSSGYPQGRVVLLLRHYREALEREYGRIMTADREALFAKSEFLTPEPTQEERESLIQAGRLVETIADMVFFAVDAIPDPIGVTTRYREEEGQQRPLNICRGGEELQHFVELHGFFRQPVLIVELTNPAFQLEYWLARTEPVRRGRK